MRAFEATARDVAKRWPSMLSVIFCAPVLFWSSPRGGAMPLSEVVASERCGRGAHAFARAIKRIHGLLSRLRRAGRSG